jgi:DNA-binding XRE family transcriptional regulator
MRQISPIPISATLDPQRSAGLPGQRSSSVGVTQRFGSKLRFLRKSKNMTQLQMAIYLGIDRSYISDLERGRKSISLPMMEVVALGFGMNLSDLLRDI